MNTKIYKEVLFLAKELMSCAHKKDQVNFDTYYEELKQICDENDGTDKDHPVQWETLADFTDDIELAISIYDTAFKKAEAVNSKDYLSSICFSAALLKIEFGDRAGAIESLEKAKIHSNKIIDKELKAEIHDLLKELQES
ncbi:tetratricopeptide repeat protein [Marinomonas colpomeniae]|uniref:Tetratricopeptide repeat protein n=1 Tax=Marinomonas colpomeniae TaxID=2774408 RepID=A0ABR8NZ67_9GAMM|nr:tetratricopeptide repeat protein [Marinomonas colpomeniae]MBD5771342.1 tetratricopeptide repeat protein [Marinomonas colpomeniae]